MKRSFDTALALLVLCAPTLGAAPALVDLGAQAFPGAEAADGGQILRFDMGTDRVNWNHARWSVLNLGGERDLSAHGGVRLEVTSPKPRTDAGVYLALREADGSWYIHGWAAELDEPVNTGVARFRDFRLGEWYSPPDGKHHDENAVFDPEAVTHVALGCVNPLGVGEVAFTVRALELVPAEGAVTPNATVRVSGKLLAINATETVPAGLFGTYAMRDGSKLARYRMAMQRHLFGTPKHANPITHMQVHCWGERVHKPIRLEEGWRERCAKAARGWAAAAAEAGQALYAEFWNEPYLNWANANRKAFNPAHYDASRAAEDGPVHIKTDGAEAPHLRWTKDFEAPPWNWTRYGRREWRRGRDEKGRVYPGEHAMPYGWSPPKWKQHIEKWCPPDDVADGETYTAEGKNLTAFTPWHLYDETQFTYWSGEGMLKMYVEPMQVFGKALKEADPKSVFYVGWGFRPSEDHWAGWHMLYKPTLDAAIEWADGVHDHDYGSDPLKMPANYEVLEAYALAAHGKWLTFVNTEQGAQTDPQAYPEAGEVSRQGYEDLNKFQWAARKMMHALRYTPDKARAFTHFGHWWSDHGEGVLFDILINFRGRLVHLECDDPHVYAVCAIDGTDPENPRPESMPDRRELVVAVLNNNVTPKEITIDVAAPDGMTFTGQVVARSVAMKGEGGRPKMIEETLGKASGTSYPLKRKLDPARLVAITLPLEGDLGAEPQVRRRQFFGKTILADVAPKTPVAETIVLDAKALAGAKRAWVKFVAQRLGEGEGTVTVGGRTYPLPSAITPENAPWIRILPIDVALLARETSLVFKASDGRVGYLLGMSSIVVEGD